MKVVMEISDDEYELPLAIADNPSQLAKLLNIDHASVYKTLARPHKRFCKYVEVEIEEDEE